MINIYKGNSANTFVTTFSENLVNYSLSGASGQTFYFNALNNLNQTEYNFSLTDNSPAYWRYNLFTINEPEFNFTTGQYAYSAFADSGQTQLLELGLMIVSGANTFNAIYA